MALLRRLPPSLHSARGTGLKLSGFFRLSPILRSVPSIFFLSMLFICARPLAAGPVHTNPTNLDPEVREAFRYFYQLDYPAAVARFERFHQEHPDDPQATALLLNAVIFQDLYRQDLLDTTFYANDGFLTGRHATQEDPKVRDRVFALFDESMRQAEARLDRNPNDVNALYTRGWIRSLKCTYVAMVERSFAGGFRLAGKAKDDEERVLELDPDYIDAKLIVGVYEYVVGALPLPFKFFIGFVGITGSKSKGLEMLYDDAHRGISSNVEARTVLALFLRREGRYKEAVQVVESLIHDYPHDYLFCLEEANLRKDDGQGMRAVEAYRELLANADRPGYFFQARMELAYYGLGEALRGQRHFDDAAHAYEQAGWTAGAGPELRVRSLLAAGQCRDLNNQRQLALRDYQSAIDAGPDTSRADSARKYLRSPYRGK